MWDTPKPLPTQGKLTHPLLIDPKRVLVNQHCNAAAVSSDESLHPLIGITSFGGNKRKYVLDCSDAVRNCSRFKTQLATFKAFSLST